VKSFLRSASERTLLVESALGTAMVVFVMVGCSEEKFKCCNCTYHGPSCTSETTQCYGGDPVFTQDRCKDYCESHLRCGATEASSSRAQRSDSLTGENEESESDDDSGKATLTGFGDSCTSDTECKGKDANYCAGIPFVKDGFCTIQGCTDAAGSCPNTYKCCMLPDSKGGPICLDETRYQSAKGSGICSNTTKVGVDAGDDESGEATVTGLGDSCRTQTECEGKDANYCLLDPINGEGLCMIHGCTDAAGSCPNTYTCCRLPESYGGSICLDETNYQRIKGLGFCGS
jgi:hypothetical protein